MSAKRRVYFRDSRDRLNIITWKYLCYLCREAVMTWRYQKERHYGPAHRHFLEMEGGWGSALADGPRVGVTAANGTLFMLSFMELILQAIILDFVQRQFALVTLIKSLAMSV